MAIMIVAETAMAMATRAAVPMRYGPFRLAEAGPRAAVAVRRAITASFDRAVRKSAPGADYIGHVVADLATCPVWGAWPAERACGSAEPYGGGGALRAGSRPSRLSAGQTVRMARLVPIGDGGDPRLADYVGLTDVHLRRSLEAEHGLFVAEGERVIRRAIEAGYPVRSMLVTEEKRAAVEDLARDFPGPLYVVAAGVAEQVTGYQVHRGALASMGRRPLLPVAEVVADSSRIVVLEDLVDHGNVGAIFRCAAALGVDAVILSPRCADPLYRRAVKVSMGAVFAIPYARMPDWHGGLAGLREAGFQLLALTPDQSAVPLTAVTAGERAALLLGTEGDGLSSRWLHEADVPVCIPMAASAMAAGVDSLNVVAAAAIACHALVGSRASRADAPGR
jgi:tRNA G18 (ribose-2'-O)-methylase SpoU